MVATGLHCTGVIGAYGGAGASSFASALARERSRTGPVALVDLDDASGGLDVLLGIEESPGLRWADLGAARGEVSGQELLELMPRWGEVAVLSCDRNRPASVSHEVRRLVLGSLGQETDLVLDLSRSQIDVAAQTCDRVLVVVPRDLRAIAGAQVTLASLARAGIEQDRVGLIARGPAPGGLDPIQVEQVLGLALVTHLRADAGLAAAIERGAGPQGRGLVRGAREACNFLDRAGLTSRMSQRHIESQRRSILDGAA